MLALGERRAVVVAFAKVDGLDSAFEARCKGLGAVQLCLTTAHEVITRRGGLLRQFISDDKGVVIIFTFGLTQVTRVSYVLLATCYLLLATCYLLPPTSYPRS